jgi:phospholipase C
VKKGLRNIALSLGALSLMATPFVGKANASTNVSVSFGMHTDNKKTTTPIKHTIVIYQENRSFDNYFGTYPNKAPGFKPLPGTPTDVNNIPAGAFNPDENGNPVYPHLFPNDQLQTKDVDHGFDNMVKMVDGGKMDMFYQINNKRGVGDIAMGYYDYNAIPAYWQYAQHFALADKFFQPVYGPSTPGALYLVAAQSGTKDQPIKGDPTPKNGPFGGDNPKSALNYNLTYKNIGDVLTENNHSWNWYEGGWDAASNNPTSAEAKTYSPHHAPFQYFQNYEDGKYKNNLKDANDFTTDIQNGTLPEVSFLKADYPNDEHPGYSTPEGQNFVAKTINSVMNSKYWKDTAIIVTYDESGGYWDHVAPANVTPGPDGLQGTGPRIPALVISPYAKQNFVSHTEYDSTSILKFIESNYKLPALNNRDASANNLTDMFDFRHPDFARYMYNDGSLKPAKTWGTPINIQINNALMGVSNPTEAAYVNKKGEVMVPLEDFARSINAHNLKNNANYMALLNKQGDEYGESRVWISPTHHAYVSLKVLVDALGWSSTTQGDTVTVTSK